MDSDLDYYSESSLSLLRKIVVVIAIIVFLVWLAIPNFVHSGPSKISVIVSDLRLIDGAKQSWASEHGITNDIQMTLEPTEDDIGHYLTRGYGDDGKDHFGWFGAGVDRYGHLLPVPGAKYEINALNKPSEAELTESLPGYPKGTIIRLGRNGPEFSFPREQNPYSRVNGVFTNN